MSDDREKVKDDVLKNPKHVLVCIQFLAIQGKPIWEAFKGFCETLGDDVMEYKDFDFWWFRFKNGECDLDYDRSKDPKKRELRDMPIKIVENIIGNLEKEERYALPNVSKSIRNVMSNLLISDLSLEVHYSSIDILFNGRKAQFKKSRHNTTVTIGDTQRTIKGDHLTIAMNQLTHILKNLKLRFDTLNVSFDSDKHKEYYQVKRNFNAIRKAFQSISHQIHVKILKMTIILDEQLMAVLPYLKPGVLESIEICSEGAVRCETKEFVDLEQFKQAKSFTSNKFIFDAPIETLLHLNSFDITLSDISIDDALFASSCFKRCRLNPFRKENIVNLKTIREALHEKSFDIPDSKDSFLIRLSPFSVLINRVFNT